MHHEIRVGWRWFYRWSSGGAYWKVHSKQIEHTFIQPFSSVPIGTTILLLLQFQGGSHHSSSLKPSLKNSPRPESMPTPCHFCLLLFTISHTNLCWGSLFLGALELPFCSAHWVSLLLMSLHQLPGTLWLNKLVVPSREMVIFKTGSLPSQAVIQSFCLANVNPSHPLKFCVTQPFNHTVHSRWCVA